MVVIKDIPELTGDAAERFIENNEKNVCNRGSIDFTKEAAESRAILEKKNKRMSSKDIIEHIRDFFDTADEKTLNEIREAASVEIDGDVSIDEYLSEFSDEYFYTEE